MPSPSSSKWECRPQVARSPCFFQKRVVWIFFVILAANPKKIFFNTLKAKSASFVGSIRAESHWFTSSGLGLYFLQRVPPACTHAVQSIASWPQAVLQSPASHSFIRLFIHSFILSVCQPCVYSFKKYFVTHFLCTRQFGGLKN